MFSTAFVSLFLLLVTAVRARVSGVNDRGTPTTATDTTDTVTSTTRSIYIEPTVLRYTHVLPRDICEKIIELGEAAGFPLEMDSIDRNEVMDKDNKNSQSIDVMDENGRINYPEIFEVLEPFIPNIAELIRNQRNTVLDRLLFPDELPNRLPKLGWIFYRKYSPKSSRNALVPHYDSNMHTVNIALNDDFTGGGIFYIKPTYAQNPDFIVNSNDKSNKDDQEKILYRGLMKDDVPDLPDYQYTYDWVNSLQHENSTGVVFPELETGDALIHNYTVWHAVAPIKTGIRYSMVLFFDMHNPMIARNIGEHITFKHKLKECDPITGRLVYIQDSIDVLWMGDEYNSMQVIKTNLSPGEEDGPIISQLGHIFRAVRSVPEGEVSPPLNARDLLATVVIESDHQEYYYFVSSFTTQDDCDIANDIEEYDL